MSTTSNPMRYAWFIVCLLFPVALLNYLDRQMLATMKASMVHDIPTIANKADWGWVLGWFKWTYAILSPFGGYIADRVSKKHVIGFSLLAWSAVTWWTGHVTTFNELVIARACMGISEAFYIPAALALIPEAARPQVLHQTGAAQLETVRAAYAAAGITADVRPFIDDMAQQLAQCDVIVCRAGAVTVSELCAAGVPSLLVPLVVSTTAHQRDNAQHMAGHGAALHIDQKTLTPASLASQLQALTRPALLAMAEQARALARPQAAARVADELDKLVSPR